MQTKKKNGKLAIQLTAMIGIPFIILNFIQAVISIETMRSKVTEQNTARYVEMSENYSTILEQTLDEIMGHLDFYVYHEIMQTQDVDTIVNWLKGTKDHRYSVIDYVAFVDKNGDFWGDNGSKTNVKERDYFKAIMNEGKEKFIDNPVTSKTTGKTVIHLSRAVKVDNKTIGFICAVINVDHFTSILNSIQIKNEGAAVLLAMNGKQLASKGDKTIFGDTKDADGLPIFDKATTDEVLNSIVKNQGGKRWNETKTGKTLTVYEPIEGTTWVMTVTLYQSIISGLASQVANIMTIFSTLLGAVVFILLFVVVTYTVKPLRVVESSITDIATGNADLTKRIDIKTNNEVGRVVDSFNLFSEKLQGIVSAMKESKNDLVDAGNNLKQSTSDTSSSITEIISNIDSLGGVISHQTDSVTGTASAVNQIASNIESLNSMIENQSAAVTQASAAVEEMIGNIGSVSKSVERMAEQFRILETESITGLQKQDDVARRIETIESESESLQEANNVISSIAEQTNLLAMNAAIEAAHAGEAGKGFSVVADEIRKLSETSSSESKTIGEQLRKIIDGINEMVRATQEARKSFSNVSSGINQTNGLVQEIHNSMEEQAEGSKQISQALHNMNDTTTEVQTASVEMANGNQAILSEIQKLQDSSMSMKQGMDEMSVGATQINQTGSTLSSIASDMEASIAKIGNQVDQFKV